jgi:hypothetical protein
MGGGICMKKETETGARMQCKQCFRLRINHARPALEMHQGEHTSARMNGWLSIIAVDILQRISDHCLVRFHGRWADRQADPVDSTPEGDIRKENAGN